jgi:hypothetical protein
LAVLVTTTAGPEFGPLGVRPAAAVASYRAAALADGMRMSFEAVNAPATNVPLDAGFPVAQAELDSLGNSKSFASHPYPGDAAVAMPGLIAGVSNGQISLPGYPFYVHADYPLVPEQKIDQGSYQLQASAQQGGSRALARSGVAIAGSDGLALASSEATTQRRDDAVTASATSEVRAFSVGPLRIGRIRAEASVRRGTGGTVDREAALDVTTMSVGDTAVGFTPKGLVVAGSNQPLPGDSPLWEVLTTAGITVRYLAPRESDTAVVSPGIEVRWTREVEGPITPLTFTWILARAVARVDEAGGSFS